MQLSKILATRLPFPLWAKKAPLPAPLIDLADYPIRTTEKLRFADTDRNGHISNSAFAVCCQNARMEFLHNQEHVPLQIDAQFGIVRFEIDFLSEMLWPGTVEIGTRIEQVGRSSVTMAQALFLEKHRVASARSTVVLIDRRTRKATPLPEATAAALRGLAGTPGLTPGQSGAAICR